MRLGAKSIGILDKMLIDLAPNQSYPPVTGRGNGKGLRVAKPVGVPE
jgi:hypothetical protein